MITKMMLISNKISLKETTTRLAVKRATHRTSHLIGANRGRIIFLSPALQRKEGFHSHQNAQTAKFVFKMKSLNWFRTQILKCIKFLISWEELWLTVAHRLINLVLALSSISSICKRQEVLKAEVRQKQDHLKAF